MDVQVQRAFIIPPSPSEPEEVPFTVFDLLAPTYHYTAIYAFSPPNPTNDALLDGLTTVLHHFPLLTASLHRDTATGRPFFVTGRGGAGALVVEATVPAALSDHLPLAPSPERVRLHAPLPEDTPHMLQVQVNRFHCGGMVVGLSTHHGAADGCSTVVFLRAWARATSGDAHRLRGGSRRRGAGAGGLGRGQRAFAGHDGGRLDAPPGPGDGVVFLIPSFHEEGGVDALVAMWEEHAKVLERIAYTMD